MLRIKCKNNI